MKTFDISSDFTDSAAAYGMEFIAVNFSLHYPILATKELDSCRQFYAEAARWRWRWVVDGMLNESRRRSFSRQNRNRLKWKVLTASLIGVLFDSGYVCIRDSFWGKIYLSVTRD